MLLIGFNHRDAVGRKADPVFDRTLGNEIGAGGEAGGGLLSWLMIENKEE